MSKEMDNYVGSLREQKRESFIAGADMANDIWLKELERAAKACGNDVVGIAVAGFLIKVAATASDRVGWNMARTPFEARVSDRPTRAPRGQPAGTATGNTTTK